jgi:hypothetical protein
MLRSSHYSIATLVLTIMATAAHAVAIPGSSSVGAPPGMVGTGLSGEYYNASVTSTAGAGSVVASNSPDAVFSASLLDYPNGEDGTTLNTSSVGSFLGVDDPGISNTFGGSVFLFSGFIEVTSSFDQDTGTAPIDVDFGIKSDDGILLIIGGVTVASFATERQFSDSPILGSASFESPGLYPIEFLYWNQTAGNRGALEWFSSISGGPTYSSPPTGTVGIVPTSILYAVPEPSTGLLMAVGLFFVGWRRLTGSH